MRPGGRYEAAHNPDHPLGVTFIHFTPRTARGAARFRDKQLPGELFHVRDGLFFDTVSTKIVRLMQAPDDPANLEQATTLFNALIQELTKPEHRVPLAGWERYRAVIERHIADIYEQPGATSSVRRLARDAALSPDHYTRIFRTIAGLPPRELIQRARLERACQLLRETSGTIGEIAEQTGYADLFQFSRLFKQRMGVAPGQWRRAARF